jgi:hypothetical protein
MTNMLMAVTMLTLQTNTETVYPSHREMIPCPDGMLGCLAAHSKLVPDANPTTRELVTTINVIETVSIPEIGLTKTNYILKVSEDRKVQVLKKEWVNDDSVGIFLTNDAIRYLSIQTNVNLYFRNNR